MKNAKAAKEASQSKQVAIETGIITAKANLEQTKVTLEETEIIAPIDGIIAYLNIEEGFYFTQNMVRTSNEIEALQSIPIVVMDTSVYEITVSIPAYQAGEIRVGQEAMLVPGGTQATAPFNSQETWPITGTVFSVNPAIDPGGRSVQVEIRTKTGTDQLRDGTYVACWIETEKKANALIAPFNAFLFEESQPYAFVVDEQNQTVERRQVTFGIQGLNSREIATGIKAGERLITDGRYRLVDQAPIRVVGQESKEVRQ